MNKESRNVENIMSVADAAAQLDCSEQYIRQLIKAGRVQGAFKHGRMWFIPFPLTVIQLERKPYGRPRDKQS